MRRVRAHRKRLYFHNFHHVDQVVSVTVIPSAQTFAQCERQMMADQRTMRGLSPGSCESGVD
jgi:hypothetical protein